MIINREKYHLLFPFFFISIILWGGGLPKASAFTCYNGSASVYNSSATFTVQVDAPTLNKSVTDVILTDMSTYAKCYGQPDKQYQDALRSNQLTISSQLTRLGYEPYIVMSGNKSTVQPVCLWPDSSCSNSYSSSKVTLPINAKLGIARTTTTTWGSGTTIPAGTEIMRMETQMRGMAQWEPWYVTWVFVLKNDMVIPNYTCTLDENFINHVSLPAVRASDLKRQGEGLSKDGETPFQFDLTCDPQTAVTITFDGTTLGGTENVLANTEAGNDNVGIQILFNNSPVKIGEPLQVISSSQAKELLIFKADYYYKGGDVGAGDVSSTAVFTFDYQ